MVDIYKQENGGYKVVLQPGEGFTNLNSNPDTDKPTEWFVPPNAPGNVPYDAIVKGEADGSINVHPYVKPPITALQIFDSLELCVKALESIQYRSMTGIVEPDDIRRVADGLTSRPAGSLPSDLGNLLLSRLKQNGLG